MDQGNRKNLAHEMESETHPLNPSPPGYVFPTRLDQFTQPMQFHCETCNATRLSVLEYENGKHTWLCCVTLCLVAGAMAFLPFYLKECKDLTHYCPSCSSKVGFKKFQAC